jgi:5-methylcytosine-specific restriction protein A
MLKNLYHTAKVIGSIVREKLKSKRSPRWNEVRDTYIKTHSNCAACGSTKNLQVHHVIPFHLHPELELDTSNLITLCMDTGECHLNVGHGGSFRFYNENVKLDSAKFLSSKKIEKQKIISEIKKSRKK